ncbi:MAG: hypothetical protein QG626_430 [Patescibacteria group bacterium]|jgi:hypothetical protein|nr:hypothetical protein [Patescibacteria group bacterium]
MLTRDEYQAQTGIASAEEAKRYLGRLKGVFGFIFVYLVAVNLVQTVADEEFLIVFSLVYLVCLAGFVAYCWRVIRLTKKVTQANILFSILFAPISWIWFYPELVKPLKIIAGEMEPPEALPVRNSRFNNALNAAWQDKKKRIAMIIAGVFALVIVVAGGMFLFTSPDDFRRSEAYDYSVPTLEWKELVAEQEGVTLRFPAEPTQESSSVYDEDFDANRTTVTYGAPLRTAMYYLSVTDYNTPYVSESNPDFDPALALSDTLDFIANGATLLTREESVVDGHAVLDYSVARGEEVLRGRMVFKDDALYVLMVNFLTTDVPTEEEYQKFITSFSFTR